MSTVTRGRVRVEQGGKRIRAVFAGQVVADTVHPLLVWEVPYYPAYYFPRDDVHLEFLAASGRTSHSPSRGDAQLSTIRAGAREAVDAAQEYAESPIEELRGYVRLDWDAMDSWFEEDEEVFTHPRDPRVRVDILASSRHVRIEIDGVTVADSVRPRLLFETDLPTRYYLPKTDVRLDLLEKSDTVTHCPYKGATEYWSVRVGDELHTDLVWGYPSPLPESQKIIGLLAFTDEKVDVYVDDVLQPRPKTKFA
ncbi:DUF427 domain-containing protein [Amycolatopsis sp.]|jgi:uncharacterized protein (DUF427 family)|uniref:DUF427 domain-containing protein n=1 Tax=Amycolatopsis sp. TaxID=37632 RepID=UPI002DFA5403|nr:DUF427 domain-containing protein [Amycolatopsis sp.]